MAVPSGALVRGPGRLRSPRSLRALSAPWSRQCRVCSAPDVSTARGLGVTVLSLRHLPCDSTPSDATRVWREVHGPRRGGDCREGLGRPRPSPARRRRRAPPPPPPRPSSARRRRAGARPRPRSPRLGSSPALASADSPAARGRYRALCDRSAKAAHL